MIGHWLLLNKTHSGVRPCTGNRPRGVTGDGQPPLETGMPERGGRFHERLSPPADPALGNSVAAIGWRERRNDGLAPAGSSLPGASHPDLLTKL